MEKSDSDTEERIRERIRRAVAELWQKSKSQRELEELEQRIGEDLVRLGKLEFDRIQRRTKFHPRGERAKKALSLTTWVLIILLLTFIGFVLAFALSIALIG
jgi:hypothetical protein